MNIFAFVVLIDLVFSELCGGVCLDVACGVVKRNDYYSILPKYCQSN